MKVISLNIECNKHYEAIFSLVKKENPELLCFQEVLETDLEYIKEQVKMDAVFIAHGYTCSEDEHYKKLRGKRFGVAIFSKTIISSGYSFYWGDESCVQVPFEEYLTRREELRSYPLLYADVLSESGEVFRTATTHFPVTIQGESTPHQLEILTPFFKKIDALGECFFCGDFNAPRGNETFTRLAQKYKDSIPEKYTTSLDQNLHRVQGLQFMVDGLFTTPSYGASEVSLIDGVSDHMAIIATMNKR